MSSEKLLAPLKELKQWHVWNYSREGVKIPLQTNGQPAKSNDPETWSAYADALGASKYYQGLAFELADGLVVGVDLDNCISEDGEVRDWALPVIERFRDVAYGEVSPSGRGVKFLLYGRKPAGARCVHKVGPQKQQIECYDHSRFWTFTGEVFGGMSEMAETGQEAIDWLCGEFLAGEPAGPAPAKQMPAPSRLPGGSLDVRAQAYIETIEGSSKGNLRNAAFSLSGHLHSMVGDFGERLSDPDVLSLLEVWNLKNDPRLKYAELVEASVNGRTNGTPRRDKAPVAVAPVGDDYIPNCPGEPAERPPVAPEEDLLFPDECLNLPGFLGEVVNYNLRTALYPLPELAVASALALLSSLTGGKVESGGARSNLFLIGLAPSGGGKDHGRKLNRRILRAAGGAELVGPERVGSHAGIVSAMAHQWNTLFQIDEIQHLAMAMQNRSAPHLAQIASVLMQIFSSADSIWTGDAYGDRKKVKTLSYPHLVLYGTAVPEGFWTAMSEENLKGGLLGRCLVFESEKYVPYNKTASVEPIPDSIVELAAGWLQLKTHSGNLADMADGSCPILVRSDEEANARLQGHAIKISQRRMEEEPIPAAIWSRAAEKTVKLALLFACSRWSGGSVPVVSIEDANLAILLNNCVTRRMLRQADRYVATSEFGYEVNKMRAMLRSKKGEWRLSDITRKTRGLRSKERNEILNTLVASGFVVQGEQNSGGRTAITFEAVE